MSALLGSRRRVRTVLQAEAMECGLACMAMLANVHRHDISLPYLRSLFPVTHRGMTLAEIVDLAGQLGLDAQGLAVASIPEIAGLRCPALLHWNGNHFVVLEKVVRGQFHVHDPAFGLRIYAADDMERHFSGIALEFEPRVDFEAIKEEKKSTLWAVFRACRGIENTVLIVTVLSFSANLFGLATPVLLEVALDTVIPQFDLDLLTVVCVGMALFASFDALARWLRDLVTLRAATLFEIYFTRNIVGHAFRLPLSFFEARHPGDFITRLTSVDHIKTFLIGGFVASVADGAMSVMMVTLMVYYSPVMAGISVGTLALAVLLRLATYPRIAQQTLATLEARSEEQGRLLDGVKAIGTLKVHNTAEFFGLKWFDSFTRFANTGFRAKKLTIDTDLMLHVMFTLGTVGTLYVGVTDVMKSQASIGVLYAFFALRTTFFTNMNALIMNLLQLSVMRVHLERLDDVLDAAAEPTPAVGTIDKAIRRTVALDRVSIRFDPAGPPILREIDLAIDVAGRESIAILGPSGCGKSSLLKVLSSLNPGASGRILVDGQPLDHFGLHEYRANIGAVFAEDTPFSGTVSENLSMFDPDIGRSRMEQALETVGLLDDVLRLPQGFATLLSGESAILSTGQRRRLMLARAICRQPRLMLLDEVTANLDPASEDAIVRALMGVPAAKVFVTHSERLLDRVDRVLRVRDGRLVEARLTAPKRSA